MSIAFKDVPNDDISITPYIAHKTWNVTDETTGSYGIKVYSAISSSTFLSTGSSAAPVIFTSGFPNPRWIRDGYERYGLSHGVYNALTWRSLDVLYYRPNRYNFLNMGQNIGSYIPNTVTKLDVSASLLSIPEQICGDGIKPKSIAIESTGVGTIRDDGTGYLISDASNTGDGVGDAIVGSTFVVGAEEQYNVGDVFYENGMVVITNTGSAYTEVFDNFQITFKGTHKIIENEYRCKITERDFMVPTNPTAMSGSGLDLLATNFPTGSGILAGFVSSSDFAPYITTIGLYNDEGELLVVGKTGQPIKNSQDYDLQFVLRFDT
tara:strand:- start:38720 stop:39685 length:966 start_codon:yes stop_codon:yes gene_type:complete